MDPLIGELHPPVKPACLAHGHIQSTARLACLCSPVANNSGVNKRQITDLVDQSIQINTHCFVVTADNRYILACGFWDKSFRVYSTETGGLALAWPLEGDASSDVLVVMPSSPQESSPRSCLATGTW